MKRIFLILALVSLVLNSSAQSLFESLGGVKTDFVILTNNDTMSILAQGIIKRDVTERDNFRVNLSKLENGFSYEVNHLEFITETEIPQSYKKIKPYLQNYYDLKLFDQADNLIHTYTMNTKWVKVYTDEQGLKTYSVDLYKIPIIILDRTRKISIEKIKTTSIKSELNANPK